ncbi:hypothetical protein BASA50_002359 [Batrachochytrium salamandrivorans]|uniref:Uncharacterized protein n=1 Tax=Batrachochytrium salamandrivorans TaxID=1357716 RepID=A0ABQ8FLH1_9FUNG|nr:hypothetical protein BASA60_010749 [Batrachochytrium salamandrivorans]KAH6569609.1 hypothetical protein BASA62_004775 [Batrachochytrium salamandrivorans]KAH6580042.1 hypothetical protein BASA61_009854 [Batrachochytrium salamandrivorans]KAH6600348.1 hypothetical protein BASA50_002359 [Batrachochytrium salamandrivorans]KAH9268839.1 hypothetical protein BASA83_009127 [Batrachochytrium salamandrivorans]
MPIDSDDTAGLLVPMQVFSEQSAPSVRINMYRATAVRRTRPPDMVDIFCIRKVSPCLAFKTCLMSIILLLVAGVFYSLWQVQFGSAAINDDTILTPNPLRGP